MQDSDNKLPLLNYSEGIKYNLGYSHDLSIYKIYKFEYWNLDAFLKTISTFPINKRIFPNPSSILNAYSFSMTHSFEEAWNLCKFGWDQNYQNFVNKLTHINLRFSQIEKLKREYSCVGYTPNVSKFLSGNPNNMKIDKKKLTKKAIKINMGISYSAFTNYKQVINRGICVLWLINYLENIGFNCIFQFESITVLEDEMIQIIIPLKRDDEKLNIKLSYFPLVHPSFLRRLIFRAIEIVPNCTKDWNDFYGYPYKKNDEEILDMKDTIYISTPMEMGIYGNDLDKDFDNFIKYIDVKYNLINYIEGNDKYGKRYMEKHKNR